MPREPIGELNAYWWRNTGVYPTQSNEWVSCGSQVPVFSGAVGEWGAIEIEAVNTAPLSAWSDAWTRYYIVGTLTAPNGQNTSGIIWAQSPLALDWTGPGEFRGRDSPDIYPVGHTLQAYWGFLLFDTQLQGGGNGDWILDCKLYGQVIPTTIHDVLGPIVEVDSWQGVIMHVASRPLPPECDTEWEEKCVGANLFACVNGEWSLVEAQSTKCGYVPPKPPAPAPTPKSNWIVPVALVGVGLLAVLRLSKLRKARA